MEESLVALLLADAGLTALVGNRVNWNVRPQGNALPAVVLTKVSGVADYTMQGPSTYEQSRVQVDCYASTFLASVTAARAVTAKLSGLRTVQGGTEFLGVFKDSERQSHEEGSGGVWMHRVSLDFLVHHRSAGQ